MRGTPSLFAFVLCAAAFTQATAQGERITARPMLPETAGEKRGDLPAAVSTAATAQQGLADGQTLYSAQGSAAARIDEIVRDKDGAPVRIILTTADGRKRYAPAGDLSFDRGRAVTRLTQAEILALPEVEAKAG